MLYCEKCKALTAAKDKCELCGNKKIRAPKVNDSVYLTTQNGIFVPMLKDLLTQNNIPFLEILLDNFTTFGARVRTGFERCKFFVPFGAFEKSKELLKELLTEIDEVYDGE